ncbi:MAG: glycerophosphodiester phosphodiesterase family protein [Gemmatimonadota bacterium]
MTAIIAHRGAAAEAPENSLGALELGMALGADALELDVRRSRDGALLVIHDATLGRTTDRWGRMADLELAEVRAARQADGTPVSELDEVFAAHPGVEITVDVKDQEAAASVVATIRAHDRVSDTILYVEDGTDGEAFRGYEGRRATSTAQALRIALAGAAPLGWSDREVPEVVHTPLAWSGVPIVTQAFVRRVQESGRTVQVWTVDDPRTARRLAAWGADGIITNDVRGMRDWLGARHTGRPGG